MWPNSAPTIPYTHKVTARARRIKISVSRTGEVVVTSPRFTPRFLIDRFVAQNQAWITQAKANAIKHTSTVPADTILLFGKTYPIQIEYSAAHKLGLRLTDTTALFNPVHDPALPKNQPAIKKSLRTHLDRLYKKTITEYLSHRLPVLAKQMGVTYSTVHVREQKTRWGSCSSTGALSFNWRLVHHPPAVIEYVLIHELAHRKQMNHSKAFWDIVRTHCPEYPKQRGWLKRTQVAED